MFATSVDLSRRIEQAASDYLLQRYSGPGNPMGTQILRIGGMAATKVPFVPNNPLMNGVHGLEDAALLPEVLAFYAATQQPCWIAVPPYAPLALTDALIRAGFRIDQVSSALVAEPVPAPCSSGVDVHEIERAELDVYLDTLNVGFDMNPAVLSDLRRNQSFWCDVPTWYHFLATVDSAPAGAAVLSIHGDIGYLAAGAVLPAYRGRGVHAALIWARLAKARSRQCKIVSCGAAWGSQSQRNQQRAGLAIAHVKCIWTNRPAPAG